jgi:hypothetical protein
MERYNLNSLTPFTDADEVLSAIKGLTDRIHLGLYRLLPITKRSFFESLGLPVDRSLHAMMTRFRLKHQLLDEQIDATDEEQDGLADGDHFSVKGVANCGLVVSTQSCVLRVLKSRNGELPPSASRERADFYQFNLFSFESSDPYPDRPLPPLNLVAAWETNGEHELGSFSIVCPWGESDNRVHNKWSRALQLPTGPPAAMPQSMETLPPEPSLDEITRKDRGSEFGLSGSGIEKLKDAGNNDAG